METGVSWYLHISTLTFPERVRRPSYMETNPAMLATEFCLFGKNSRYCINRGWPAQSRLCEIPDGLTVQFARATLL